MGWAAVDSPCETRSAGLLGREEDIEAVAGALAVSRLVTLTGPPGIGKTRLALAVADRHTEPTVVVELAQAADGSLIAAALASALSVQEAPGHSLMEAVAASIRRRRFLLLIDNCEHVREGCRAAIAQLLNGCHNLTVLATSREPLEAPGEQLYPVAPLRVPSRGEETDPEALLAYPAIELFVARAAGTQLGFRLTAPLALDVADICRRLDGIPLAIELAAARMGTMTANEIARRLEAHLGLLSEHPRGPLPRHQTLTSALDWSHGLLSDAERSVFRHLSVFVGTFELEAAAAVCADEVGTPSEISDLLDRLVAKSLVVRDADPDRPGRYRLLETVRAYAAEKLEQAGTVAVARTVHARFYTALAERAEPEFTGPRQLDWFDRIADERANIRAALDWSLVRGRADEALRLAGALVLFWRVRGPYSEGRDLLEAALSASYGEPPGLRAKALWGAGFMTLMTGNDAGAIPPLKHSLTLYRELDDQQGCARALLLLANAGVPATLEESLRLARAAADHWCLAHALGVAGWSTVNREELHEARSIFEECVAVAREAGDQQGLRFGLIGLGASAAKMGDFSRAEVLLTEAIEVTGLLGEDYDRAEALKTLADLWSVRGDYDRARALLGDALSLLPELAPRRTRSNTLLSLAQVVRGQGDCGRARSLLADLSVDGQDGIPVLLELGFLALDEQDPSTAGHRFDEALALARSLGDKRGIAGAFMGLGRVADHEGDTEVEGTFLAEALILQLDIADLPGVVRTFDIATRLAARGHDHERAARLVGAAETLCNGVGFAFHPSLRSQPYVDLVRRSLGGDAFDRALAQGRALELDQAVGEVLACQLPTGPASGWASLSEREVRIAILAAEGLSNPEIAARLMVSRATVKLHLRRIYTKLGVTGRWDLAREAAAHSARPPAALAAEQI